MKLDMELCRKILIAVEEDPSPNAPTLEFPDIAQDVLDYHLILLAEGGLLCGAESRTRSRSTFIPTRLTWEGHQFVTVARSQEAWAAARGKMVKAGIELTLGTMKELANRYVRDLVGLG